MSSEPKSGYRWLDSLARWSAGGRADAHPPEARDGDVSVAAGGTTRRTALRTAAGTAGALALSGSLRLLQPPIAGATPLGECQLASLKAVRDDFQACVKDPLQAFEAAEVAIADAENHLLDQKKPAARKRLLKIIDRATRERGRALKNLEFCNAVFVQDQGEGEAKCQAANPPSGGTGGGGTGGSGGCDPGFLLCNDYCCDTNNAYCQGCTGRVVCCRIGSDCCPSG